MVLTISYRNEIKLHNYMIISNKLNQYIKILFLKEYRAIHRPL